FSVPFIILPPQRSALFPYTTLFRSKAGAPIVFRINRELTPVDAPPPAVEWVDAVVKTIVPPHLRKRFDEEGEVDFSYFLPGVGRDRKSTRLNSSHQIISYAVFCLKN